MRYFLLLLCALSLFADTLVIMDSSSEVSAYIQSDKSSQSQSKQKAGEFDELIESACAAHGVDTSLAKAIVKVESNFNPMAVSATGAIGLMQIKTDQALPDVYTLLKSNDLMPSVAKLHDPKTNIDIGVAYLSIIQNRFLREIKDAKTKEYCAIAAYNAGAGTVLRFFDANRTKAATLINAMHPTDVLRLLTTKLPSEQGRRYLQKVLFAKEKLKEVKARSGELMESLNSIGGDVKW